VVEENGHQRFRFLGHDGGPGRAYLVSADNGYTYYRIDPPAGPDEASIALYAVDYLGKQVATLRVSRQGENATLEGDGFLTFPPLRIIEHAPGLYFCAMGEALDLTTDRPTYANIPLRPLSA
jgi:hypothetical protein